MKVLIWVSTLLVLNLLNIVFGYATGFRFGYIIIIFLYFFIAKKLCKMWDERNNPKTSKEELSDTEDGGILEKFLSSEEHKEHKFKCEMCGEGCDKITYAKIKDDMGTRYRNLCDSCMKEYNAVSIDEKK